MAVFRKKDAWWIDFYYRGKRFRQKIGTRKKDAEDALSRIRVKIATGDFVPLEERKTEEDPGPESISFAAFAADEFLPWSKAQHSESHYIRLESIVRTHLHSYFSGDTLEDITTKRIEDYKTMRLRKGRYQRGRKTFPVSEATINRELCCIKVILRKAEEWGQLDESPARRGKAFKEKTAKQRLLEVDEIARLLEEVPAHFHALVTCAVYAGLRRAELFHLRWEDIRWKTGELTVASRREHHTKNYESRRIPMNQALIQALRTHKREHIVVGNPYVFSNPEGKPYTDIREPLNDAAKRAGIADSVKLHQLRHAFCSHALMSGVDPRTVQKWMGHKDLKTTLRYAHVSPDHEKAAIQNLSYVLDPASRAGLIRETASSR